MKELVSKPGIVAREYLDGKRKKYFNPLSFLVILTSLYAYVTYQAGYFEALSKMDNAGMGQGASRMPAAMKEAMVLTINYGKVIGLFVTPILISFFSWLLSIRSKRNLAENLVLNSFLMGQIYIVMIVVFIPAFILIPDISVRLNNNAFHLLMWLYMTVAYKQFFGNHVVWAAIKALLNILLFIIFFWVTLYAFVVVKHLILG